MSGTLVNYSFLTFIVASFVYAGYNFIKRENLSRILGYVGSVALFVGVVLMTAAIIIRWQQAGRPPFSNMYESLILFSWAIALIYLVLELAYGVRIAGVFASILAVVAIAAASFFDSTIDALVPALQSNWLLYHVLTCFVGYAAFAVSVAASIVYLILRAKGKAPKAGGAETPTELVRVLQSFNYEAVRFGFLFLGVGIITGAVWANEAWGTYWSWDAKETASLVTWIIYAIMIHFKYVSGRFGIKDINLFNAICSIVGFLAVIFTYFGVNFWISGLHSYS
ncbi:MAG: c-type cytochrome biogenesis protein CcsB [Candidatus Lindowbacteria bacterium]|nr:c-type cytochrome biogenesis protein CcsB [Candidatus Lindowbacteria bacterium]